MPTSSPAPSRAVPSKLGIGCLGVLVPLMGGLLFVSLGGEGGWWVFVPPVMVGVYLFLARHERGTLRAFFNALGAVVLAPLLYILVRAALGLSIGRVPFLDDGCDPPWINEATPFLEGLFSVVYYTPIGVVGFLVARWLVWRECRPLEPLLHRASLGALILGALLFLGLLPRALTASDPRHYIANLPVLGVVPPVSGEPADVVGMRGFSARIYEAPIADIVVSRICPSDRSTCWIDARPAGAPRPKGKDLLVYEHEGVGLAVMWFGETCYPPEKFEVHDAPLVVREDAAQGLVVFEGELVRAMRRPSLSLVDVRMSELADVTSPPWSLMVMGAMGLGLALFLKVRRRRLARRMDRIAAARVGVLDEAGWIEFQDGTAALRVGPEARLAPGPVVVLEGAARGGGGGGPYRGGGRGDDVEILPGERDELLARERRALAPLDAHALAVVALTAAPLMAAAQVWLR